MKLECVAETELNAAFKTRDLSPFPTAMFEVASAQCVTALIGLADLRVICVSGLELEDAFSKKPTCLHLCASIQKL